jgi:hypothetical protein
MSETYLWKLFHDKLQHFEGRFSTRQHLVIELGDEELHNAVDFLANRVVHQVVDDN